MMKKNVMTVCFFSFVFFLFSSYSFATASRFTVRQGSGYNIIMTGVLNLEDYNYDSGTYTVDRPCSSCTGYELRRRSSAVISYYEYNKTTNTYMMKNQKVIIPGGTDWSCVGVECVKILNAAIWADGLTFQGVASDFLNRYAWISQFELYSRPFYDPAKYPGKLLQSGVVSQYSPLPPPIDPNKRDPIRCDVSVSPGNNINFGIIATGEILSKPTIVTYKATCDKEAIYYLTLPKYSGDIYTDNSGSFKLAIDYDYETKSCTLCSTQLSIRDVLSTKAGFYSLSIPVTVNFW